ncbi:MAG: flippase-like domain-containing protein [Aquificaceae bacterium]|nr:flippase-like domain-containing protein [Aquificaceae bacterium]
MKKFIPPLLTLVFLTFLLYFVPFKELKETFRRLNPSDVFLAFLFYSLSQIFRSLRWKLLLKDFTFLQSFAINSANIMFNNLLPARTGELSWFYYAKRLGVNLSYSLWSFFLGRLYDLLSLSFLLLLSLSPLYKPLLFLALFLLFFSLFFYRLYLLLPSSGRLSLLKNFVRREASFRLCAGLFLLSSFSSLSKFISLLLLLDMWGVALHRVFIAFLGGELSSSLPLHSFMGFGTYEFAFSLPLRFLGESLKDWLKMGFTFHSFLLLSSFFWGIPSALLLSRGRL